MSVIEGKTYYVPNYALNLDIRPLDEDEWGKFDGFLAECRIKVAETERSPCGFRCFKRKAQDTCPCCGNYLAII